MRHTWHTAVTLLFLVTLSIGAKAQQPAPARNMVIFLLDGYRWREIFQGADSGLLADPRFNHTDSAWTVAKYWDSNVEARRHKLMPFTWETIAHQGLILGNREYGNFVNVKNKYWFSYPGRSESFAGYYDSAVNSNEYPDNPNTNVLEFINQDPAFHGKIATFASWDAVARILNRHRNGMLVNVFREDVQGDHLTSQQVEANHWQHFLPEIFGKGERMDAGTYALAKAYLLANHPRILYIDLIETDDFGHFGLYGEYLDAAHDADAMFREVWTFLQQDPFYKDNTDMMVFSDHGRGIGPSWTSHGSEIPHSNETYFLAMGPGIPAKGEIKTPGQIYQEQFAQTIAALLGFHFTATHPVAGAIEGLPAR